VMNRKNAGNPGTPGKSWPIRALALAVTLSLAAVSGADAVETPDLASFVEQPAELSAWAYAYQADLKVQDKPGAWFVSRRLERLDRVYRPVDLLLARVRVQDNVEKRSMLPAPSGDLQSALLWEGRVQLDRVELQWPKNASTAPPQESVEVRVYPAPFGWFGWQADQRVTVLPAISQDGSTWIYQAARAGESIPTTACLPPKEVGLAWGGTAAGNSNEVDMVAVFVQPPGRAKKENSNERAKCPVPQIRAYGPEHWKRMDVEIEWGFKEGAQKATTTAGSKGSSVWWARWRLCQAMR
jgi:hypothetical protein